MQAGEPFVAFFRGDGPLFAGGSLPHGRRVAGPDLSGKQPERYPLRGEGERRVDRHPAMRGVRQGAETGRRGMGRPVDCCRILDG